MIVGLAHGNELEEADDAPGGAHRAGNGFRSIGKMKTKGLYWKGLHRMLHLSFKAKIAVHFVLI